MLELEVTSSTSASTWDWRGRPRDHVSQSMTKPRLQLRSLAPSLVLSTLQKRTAHAWLILWAIAPKESSLIPSPHMCINRDAHLPLLNFKIGIKWSKIIKSSILVSKQEGQELTQASTLAFPIAWNQMIPAFLSHLLYFPFKFHFFLSPII